MTELQLKIVERADKTLSFGCIVEKGIYLGQRDDISHYVLTPENEEDYASVRFYGSISSHSEFKEGFNPNIIGHPYGFERILYLHWQKLPPNESQQAINFQKIIDYIKQKNQRPLIEKCIDWDEEGQQIVLDFLLSLPK